MHFEIIARRPAGPTFQPKTEIILCRLGENKATPQCTWVRTPDGARYLGHYFTPQEIAEGKAQKDFETRTKL